MKTEHKLNILGRELSIVSEHTPERIREIEGLVAERVGAMGGGGGVPMYTAALLACLNLAEDLIKERQAHGKLKEKIRSRSVVLLEKLDQLNFAA